MAALAKNYIPGNLVCTRLRSKGMLLAAEPDPTVPDTSDGYFWCMETMNCLGPDREVANRDNCQNSRSCFKGYGKI